MATMKLDLTTFAELPPDERWEPLLLALAASPEAELSIAAS